MRKKGPPDKSFRKNGPREKNPRKKGRKKEKRNRKLSKILFFWGPSFRGFFIQGFFSQGTIFRRPFFRGFFSGIHLTLYKENICKTYFIHFDIYLIYIFFSCGFILEIFVNNRSIDFFFIKSRRIVPTPINSNTILVEVNCILHPSQANTRTESPKITNNSQLCLMNHLEISFRFFFKVCKVVFDLWIF